MDADNLLKQLINFFTAGTVVGVGFSIVFVLVGAGQYIMDAMITCMIVGAMMGVAKGLLDD